MLEDVIGQVRAKKVLNLLSRTYDRKGTMPPVGFFGSTGLGKTHLATEWANELGAKLLYINGTAVKDALAFRSFFDEARKDPTSYYIVFVDECHGLPNKVQENLLSVLEDPAILCTVAPRDMGVVTCVDKRKYIEKGDIIREALPTNMSFALATTDPAKMKDTILNRLRKVQLEPYTIDDKIAIAKQHLVAEGVNSNLIVHEALANRSRSIRHLKHELCETFVDLHGLFEPDEQLDMLDDMLGIDGDGATDLDRDYLEYLAAHTMAGVDTLAGRIGIDKKELLTRIEPYLLGKGWIAITGRGRTLTEEGRKKIFGDEYEVRA